jgi:hypothetical protein
MKPTHVTFSLTPELLTTIDEGASAEGLNRSRYIVKALEAYTSGSIRADMIPSYTQNTTEDTTRVLLLEREIRHKDELLKARDEIIEVYRAVFSGRATALPEPKESQPEPEPKKRGFWSWLRRGKE